MITRKLQLLVLICLVGLSTTVTAQKIIKKANKQFELRAYDQAYDTYVKALEKYPEKNILKLQIAECLRRTNKVLESKEWYEIAMKNEDVPVRYNLFYGHLLKSVAEYDKATHYYSNYKMEDVEIAEHYMVSCSFAINLMREQSKYELMLDDCNSKQSDIGAKFYGDDMVFTSFRDNDADADVNGCRLYIKSEGVESKPLRSAIKTQHGLGFITYAMDEEICAFTSSNVMNNHEPVAETDEDHSIHFAQVINGGDFIEEVPFKYNEVNSSTAFPHLAFDGSALYFSSNRQGGFGGYDLYVCYNKGGEWTAPENLGSEINTVGNEITPFFDGVNLYFASNYHAGMGGYDLFQSDVVMGEWTYPLNLGNGINSPGDDYYPALKQGDKTLYFSSNRLGGRGGDDIYFGIPTQQEILYSVNDIYNNLDVPQAIKIGGNYSPSSIEIQAELLDESNTQLVSDSDVTKVKVITENDIKELESRSNPNKLDVEKVVSPEILSIVGESNNNSVDHLLEIAAKEKDQKSENVVVNNTHTSQQKTEWLVDVSLLPTEKCSTIESYENMAPINNNKIVTIEKTIQVNDVIDIETDQKEITAEQVSIETTQSQKPSATKLITEVPGSRAITADISMAGAKRVSYGDLLPAVSTAYFIQLASLSRSNGNVADYKNLIKYGNIYKMYRESSTKIKLGYFTDKYEANKVLNNVKAQGYNDAFITTESLSTANMELFIAGKEYDYDGSNYTPNTTQWSQYKVRLASYEDPIWFDIKSAKQLGEIEQWTKGGWTIFILSGFHDIEEAHAAKIRAINRGFADAEVVIDNGGILERIKTN